MAVRTYHFTDVEACVMCRRPSRDAKVLGLRLNRSQGRSPKSKTGIAVSVCRCRGCGLIFPNPLPRPAKLADHYGVPPEEYWQDRYFKPGDRYFEKQITTAKQLLGFQAGMAALDIGVGIGKAMTAMADAGFDVWGIEPSAPFRDKAVQLTRLPAERILQVAVEDADFPAESFDLITFGAVLEHLYDPALAIARVLAWLKPQGVIHAEIPSSDHLIAKLINTYFRLVGTNFVTNISPMHPPFHIHEFTPQSFYADGARSGYEIAEYYYDVASIRHVPRLIHPLLRFIMARTETGMQLTVWLRKSR